MKGDSPANCPTDWPDGLPAGLDGETGERWATSLGTGALPGTFLGTFGCKVFVTVANATPHNVPLPVLRILLATVALTAGVASMSLALTSEIGHSVILGPKEAFTLPLALAATFFSLLVQELP